MTMVALKPVQKGEEIFNDYGQLPRSDLLRRYGYITENYKKWDVVEIDIETIVNTADAHIGLEGSLKEARVSSMMALNGITLSLCRFSSRMIGRCLRMGMTCNANQLARLSTLILTSYS